VNYRSLVPFDHSGRDQPDQAQGRLDVDLDHLVKHLVGHVECRPVAEVRSAVIHQYVDRPEPLSSGTHQSFQIVRPADVTGDRHDLSRQGFEFPSGLLEVVDLAAGNDDPSTCCGKPLCDRLANPSASPGYYCDLPLQTDARAHYTKTLQ